MNVCRLAYYTLICHTYCVCEVLLDASTKFSQKNNNNEEKNQQDRNEIGPCARCVCSVRV